MFLENIMRKKKKDTVNSYNKYKIRNKEKFYLKKHNYFIKNYNDIYFYRLLTLYKKKIYKILLCAIWNWENYIYPVLYR